MERPSRISISRSVNLIETEIGPRFFSRLREGLDASTAQEAGVLLLFTTGVFFVGSLPPGIRVRLGVFPLKW
jgi:hypothetical protein